MKLNLTEQTYASCLAALEISARSVLPGSAIEDRLRAAKAQLEDAFGQWAVDYLRDDKAVRA